MGLFRSHESYLGIDIGSSAVKLVEYENVKGRPKLLTYGYVEQHSDILTTNSPAATKQIVDAIQQVRETSRAQSTQVVAALPSFTVFTSIISLPQMPKKELAAAVQWEAKKFVPMPVEEMVLDWKILETDNEFVQHFAANNTQNGFPVQGPQSEQSPEVTGERGKITEKGTQFIKVLLTAAPKDLVSRYLEVFKQSGLSLVSLETESFALERSLVGNDKAPVMLIDIGATATTISVIVGAVPLIHRSIDIGGETITKTIASSLNIDQARAEQFKRDFGVAQSTGSATSQIPKRIEFMVQSIVNEVKYVLNLYQSQGSGHIEKVVLAGGSAWLPNITQYLNQMLGIKVFIGDPWSRAMYPVELQPVLQQLGPRFAVASGLAMREIH